LNLKSNLIVVLAFYLIIVSCKKDYDNLASGSRLLIGKEYFNEYPDDPIIISNAEIGGDILSITFSASCCSNENWVTNLAGSETVLYSDPPQRQIRLSFKNENPTCDMLCGKTVQFDLTPTKLDNTNTIKLNLSGWTSQLTYNY
jgi:hypothetical protein